MREMNGAKRLFEGAEGSLQIAKTAGKVVGLIGTAFTAVEAMQDGKFTIGDGAKVVIGLTTTFTPAGWIYGAADLLVGITTGTTITDRIGEGIDSAIRSTR